MMLEKRITKLEVARDRAWKLRKEQWSNPDETIYWKANRELHKLNSKLQQAYNVRAWMYAAYKLTNGGPF